MKLIISVLSGSEEKTVKEITTLEDFEKVLKAAELVCNHVDKVPTVILEKWITDNEWHLSIVNINLF